MRRPLCKYMAKLFAQKLLGAVPYGYRMQEWVKRKNRLMPARGTSSALARRVKGCIRLGKAHSIRPPKTVIEQGTGWQWADSIALYLLRANEFYEIFRRSGFQITTDNVECRAEDESYARDHLLPICLDLPRTQRRRNCHLANRLHSTSRRRVTSANLGRGPQLCLG